MTIAAAYLSSEGVVLGADSTTTVSGGPPGGPQGVLQLLEHAQKVFEVGENSRLGVCTWGAGSLGPISHRTLIAQLAEQLDVQKATVAEAASRLKEMAEALVNEHGVPMVGYYLGGWNPKSHEPACHRIVLGKAEKVSPENVSLTLGQGYFSGHPEFFVRIFHGYAPELPALLKRLLREQLKSSSMNPADFDKAFDKAFMSAKEHVLTRYYPDLPIREAIDFIYSYLYSSIKALKFRFGAPPCGGPIEIGFITSDRRFRWARHKSFTSAIHEQEGECDVFAQTGRPGR